MEGFFGSETGAIRTRRRGLFNLPLSARWGDASLHYEEASLSGTDDRAARYCVVEVPASALALLADGQWLKLARRLLELGGRASRVDIACDWFDCHASKLIPSIVRACRREEHVGCKRWKPVEEFGLYGVHVAEGVNLGLRGKNGSGRYVRVYDKGLETETLDRGQWVRWELEATGEVARDTLMMLITAEEWAPTAVEIALGAVDFRATPNEKNVSRRKRCAWWQRMLPTEEAIRVRGRRPLTNLAGYAKWVKEAVLPVLASMSAATGYSWGEFAERLGWGGEVAEDAMDRQLGRELRQFLDQTKPGDSVEAWHAVMHGKLTRARIEAWTPTRHRRGA